MKIVLKYLRIAVAVVIMLIVSMPTYAHDFEVDGIYYNIIDKNAQIVEVTYDGSYSNKLTGMLKIPSSVNYNGATYSVIAIGSLAFYECVGLTSVIVPNSVATIGYKAFENCINITSVDIPNSVISIGDEAFSCCMSLFSISIPNSVISIGDHAFSYCQNLKSVDIPNSVIRIGNAAFLGCGITSVFIPNSVTEIGHYVIGECPNLTSIVVEEGNIVYDSRDNCNAIIHTSTNALIMGCKTTTIPSSVTEIGGSAFGCCSITSISIPESVIKIGEFAFSDCSNLTSIIIPNSVTSIGNWAFSGCPNLMSIVVKEDNSEFDSRNNCNAIIHTSTNTLIVGCKNTFIPNSVISIGYRAFSGSNITSINIPKSVTSIDGSAFANCKKLTSIVVKRGNRTFDSRNNCNAIIHTSTNTLVAGCKNTIIPKTVTTIGYHSFSECANLTSITIPKSVTKIDDWAFANCGDLTSITIPKTVREIGEYVFQGCTELTSVALSRSVTKIRRGTFANCLSLTSITIPYSVTEIEESAFLNCLLLYLEAQNNQKQPEITKHKPLIINIF